MKNQNHILPVAAAAAAPAAKGVVALGSAIGSLLSKALPGLADLGQITPGIIDKKLAAGIAAGHALGYSDEQLRREPLYSIVAAIGEFPYTIKAVVNDPRPLFQRIANERGLTLPTPDLNAFPYSTSQVCGDGTAWCSKIPALIEPVFGKGVAELSRTRQQISSLPPAATPGITEPVSARIQDATQKRTQEPPADQSLSILKPLVPAMDAGLKAIGQIPPTDLEAKAQLFYDKIVVPAGGGSYSLDEDIINAIIAFVAAKAAKKQAGEAQSPVYDKIGEITLKVEDQIATTAKTQVDKKIGGFLTDNLPMFLLALGALFLFASFSRKAK